MDSIKIKKILFINFITIATFNIAHPVTPSLINALMMPSYMFGVLYSTMAISHFVMSPIWGSMSDQKGRKTILVLGVVGYGISQLGFGFSGYTPLILLFRITGGAMSVAFITTCIAYFIFNLGNRLPFVISGICCLLIILLVRSISYKDNK